MPYYLILEAGEAQRSPGYAEAQGVMTHPPDYRGYTVVTVVEGDDATDAVQQVAGVTRRLGGYVAVECEPVTIDLKPRRLLNE
jgi:transcription antitermination factor NusG